MDRSVAHLGCKNLMLSCVRYFSIVLGAPCCTKLPRVSFHNKPVKCVAVRNLIKLDKIQDKNM